MADELELDVVADDRLDLRDQLVGAESRSARPSSSTSISLNNVDFSPPRTIVTFTVFRSIGASVTARSRSSRSAASVSRGLRERAHYCRLCAAARADTDELARNCSDVHGQPVPVEIAQEAPKRADGAAPVGIRPVTAGPAARRFQRQICFSATWIG